MTERDLHYAFVLPVQAYPLGPQRFAVEGAFADHLRLMLRMHKPRFSRITLAGPAMSTAKYQEREAYLVELGASDDSIRFVGWLRLMLEAVDGSRERSTKLYRDMILHLEPRFATVPYNPFPLRYRLTKSFPLFPRHSAQRVASSVGIHGYLKKRGQELR